MFSPPSLPLSSSLPTTPLSLSSSAPASASTLDPWIEELLTLTSSTDGDSLDALHHVLVQLHRRKHLLSAALRPLTIKVKLMPSLLKLYKPLTAPGSENGQDQQQQQQQAVLYMTLSLSSALALTQEAHWMLLMDKMAPKLVVFLKADASPAFESSGADTNIEAVMSNWTIVAEAYHTLFILLRHACTQIKQRQEKGCKVIEELFLHNPLANVLSTLVSYATHTRAQHMRIQAIALALLRVCCELSPLFVSMFVQYHSLSFVSAMLMNKAQIHAETALMSLAIVDVLCQEKLFLTQMTEKRLLMPLLQHYLHPQQQHSVMRSLQLGQVQHVCAFLQVLAKACVVLPLVDRSHLAVEYQALAAIGEVFRRAKEQETWRVALPQACQASICLMYHLTSMNAINSPSYAATSTLLRIVHTSWSAEMRKMTGRSDHASILMMMCVAVCEDERLLSNELLSHAWNAYIGWPRPLNIHVSHPEYGVWLKQVGTGLHALELVSRPPCCAFVNKWLHDSHKFDPLVAFSTIPELRPRVYRILCNLAHDSQFFTTLVVTEPRRTALVNTSLGAVSQAKLDMNSAIHALGFLQSWYSAANHAHQLPEEITKSSEAQIGLHLITQHFTNQQTAG